MRFCALLLAWLSVTIPARADSVDDYIHAQMKERRIPGVALKIIEQGRDAKTAAYGLANLELGVPVRTNSVFEIGSITKQFTASCILLLQQDGRLSVDDPIAKHLKGIPPAWSNITIRQLLSHTSGIKSYTGLDGFELRRHLTQAQFLAALGPHPLDFPPGDSWKYSNSGFSLLGYIIENVSGKSYWEFLRERILTPLGMQDTGDRNPANLLTNRVDGYEQSNQHPINRDYDLTDVFSAGAIVSTVEDLAKWNRALGTEVPLTAASKAAAWTPQKLNSGKPVNYGLGWFLETVDGQRVVGHGGETSGFNGSVQRFQDGKLIVILLANGHGSFATGMARQVARLWLGH